MRIEISKEILKINKSNLRKRKLENSEILPKRNLRDGTSKI